MLKKLCITLDVWSLELQHVTGSLPSLHSGGELIRYSTNPVYLLTPYFAQKLLSAIAHLWSEALHVILNLLIVQTFSLNARSLYRYLTSPHKMTPLSE